MNDPFSWHDSNFKCHDTLGLLLTSCLYVSRHCTEESFFHLLRWGISGWSWAHPRRQKSICYQLPATKFVHLILLSSTPEVCHKWFLLLKFTPWPLCDTSASAQRHGLCFSPPFHFVFICNAMSGATMFGLYIKIVHFPLQIFLCTFEAYLYIWNSTKTDLDMAFSIFTITFIFSEKQYFFWIGETPLPSCWCKT